jgi:hypothetical protein
MPGGEASARNGLDLETLEFTLESIGEFDVGTKGGPSDLFDVVPALAEQLRAVIA